MANITKERLIPEMCEGCARARRYDCAVIKEPIYIYNKHGYCWAWVSPERAKEIEEEIAFAAGRPGREG